MTGDARLGRYARLVTGEDLLGPIDVIVLEALHRGALRARCTAKRIPVLRDDPAGERLLHETLRRCERHSLVASTRRAGERSYALTPKGRARLRTHRRFGLALASLVARSHVGSQPPAA